MSLVPPHRQGPRLRDPHATGEGAAARTLESNLLLQTWLLALTQQMGLWVCCQRSLKFLAASSYIQMLDLCGLILVAKMPAPLYHHLWAGSPTATDSQSPQVTLLLPVITLSLCPMTISFRDGTAPGKWTSKVY